MRPASSALAQGFLESWIVVHGGEVIVRARLLAEWRSSSTDRWRWLNVSSPVSPASVAKHA